MTPATRDTMLSPTILAALRKQAEQHKYDHGHALILSGGLGRSGAARLAARGALRVGAGLVTVAAPADALPECAAQLTAIMLRACDGVDDLTAMLQDARITALCMGPGLGLGPATRALVTAAARDRSEAHRALVLDADALTSFADQPNDLCALLHDRAVLTPHEGEFARLFPDLAPALSADGDARTGAVVQAARRAGCIVLLKGASTLVASRDGRVAINDATGAEACTWLATAGSGDVLAGIIAGLLARRLAPFDAATSGAWLHAEAARQFGPGLIAEDLPDMLPRVFRSLGV